MPYGGAEYLWTKTKHIHNDGPPRICGQQVVEATVDKQHKTLYTRQKKT